MGLLPSALVLCSPEFLPRQLAWALTDPPPGSGYSGVWGNKPRQSRLDCSQGPRRAPKPPATWPISTCSDSGDPSAEADHCSPPPRTFH